MKAEGLDLTHERVNELTRDAPAVAFGETRAQQSQVFGERRGVRVRVAARAHGFARIVHSLTRGAQSFARSIRSLARGVQAVEDEREEAAIDFFLGATRRLKSHARESLLVLFERRGERDGSARLLRRSAESFVKLSDSREVKIEYAVARHQQRVARAFGRNVGVAVAVAAYPRAEAHDARQFARHQVRAVDIAEGVGHLLV